MNLRIHVISGNQLPIADPTGSSDPYVIVYQYGQKKIKIGATKVLPQTINPVWNQYFDVHGVRGMRFKFVIYDYDTRSAPDKMGKCFIDSYTAPLGKDFWVPIYPAVDSSLLPPGWAPKLLIRLEKLPSQCIPSPLANQPIPSNFVIYASVAFNPPYLPELPIVRQPLQYFGPPFCLSLVAFDQSGRVTTIVNDAEPIGDGALHSGTTLTWCYDTYAASIRIDCAKLFAISSRVLLFVSAAPGGRLDQAKWLATDLYLSTEKMCESPDGTLELRDIESGIARFHSRQSVQFAPGAVASVSCMLTPTMSGIVVTPIQWSAPSQFCQMSPTYPQEVLPELAALAGVPPYMMARRICASPGLPASLDRAMALNGYHTIVPAQIGLGWKAQSDFDASCLVFDCQLNFRAVVFYNNLQVYNGALFHSGDQRRSTSDIADSEVVTVDFARLPPEAHFLAFCVTNYQGDNFKKLKAGYIRVMIGNGQEIYRLNLNKGVKLPGLFFMVLYRSGPTTWGLLPIKEFSREQTPVKIQPFVRSCLGRRFNIRV